jgi:hypothetical protein
MEHEQIPSQNNSAEPQLPEQLSFNFENREAWIEARAKELQKEQGLMKSYAIDCAWQEWKAKEWKEKSN